MIELDSIYCGDNAVFSKQIPDNYIDLTVTSPPYDDLRKYNGFVWDFEFITKELFRVTKSGGVVVWIVNDSTINGCESMTSFKQAIYFVENCGFKLHDTMIWNKENGMPLTSNRYEPHFEYMFVFCKDKLKTFNPIKEKCRYFGEKKGHAKNAASLKENSAAGRRVSGTITKEFKIKGNIWNYNTGYMQSSCDDIAFQHPAIFPEALARDHILSWSNQGDIVLDPFMGSGTVAKMAKQTGRHYICLEISQEYCDIAENRLRQEYIV